MAETFETFIELTIEYLERLDNKFGLDLQDDKILSTGIACLLGTTSHSFNFCWYVTTLAQKLVQIYDSDDIVEVLDQLLEGGNFANVYNISGLVGIEFPADETSVEQISEKFVGTFEEYESISVKIAKMLTND